MLCRNMLKLIENVILKVKMYISLLVRAAPNVLINVQQQEKKIITSSCIEMSGYFQYTLQTEYLILYKRKCTYTV